jgi:hypothetical protein
MYDNLWFVVIFIDKILSGKSGEREVKMCKNQGLLPPS